MLCSAVLCECIGNKMTSLILLLILYYCFIIIITLQLWVMNITDNVCWVHCACLNAVIQIRFSVFDKINCMPQRNEVYNDDDDNNN